jgi:hypothetical protein
MCGSLRKVLKPGSQHKIIEISYVILISMLYTISPVQMLMSKIYPICIYKYVYTTHLRTTSYVYKYKNAEFSRSHDNVKEKVMEFIKEEK